MRQTSFYTQIAYHNSNNGRVVRVRIASLAGNNAMQRPDWCEWAVWKPWPWNSCPIVSIKTFSLAYCSRHLNFASPTKSNIRQIGPFRPTLVSSHSRKWILRLITCKAALIDTRHVLFDDQNGVLKLWILHVILLGFRPPCLCSHSKHQPT